MQNIEGKNTAIDKFKIRKYNSSEYYANQRQKSSQKRNYFATVLPKTKNNFGLNKSQSQSIHENPNKFTRHSDLYNIIEKEKGILKKLLHTKTHKMRGKRCLTQTDDELLFHKSPNKEIESLQIQILKPTQRYFHYLNNVKLVEKILLAKPSEQINRQSQKTFYKNQKRYKMNLRKISCQASKQIVHKRSWMD